jgi:hypothetical protein
MATGPSIQFENGSTITFMNSNRDTVITLHDAELVSYEVNYEENDIVERTPIRARWFGRSVVKEFEYLNGDTQRLVADHPNWFEKGIIDKGFKSVNMNPRTNKAAKRLLVQDIEELQGE